MNKETCELTVVPQKAYPGEDTDRHGIRIDVYLDESLKRFTTVFPAVGSGNSAIELNLDELFKYSNAIEWIDVCKLPEPQM